MENKPFHTPFKKNRRIVRDPIKKETLFFRGIGGQAMTSQVLAIFLALKGWWFLSHEGGAQTLCDICHFFYWRLPLAVPKNPFVLNLRVEFSGDIHSWRGPKLVILGLARPCSIQLSELGDLVFTFFSIFFLFKNCFGG